MTLGAPSDRFSVFNLSGEDPIEQAEDRFP